MWWDSVAPAPGPAGWQQGGARLCGSPSGMGGPQGWQVTHGRCLSVPMPAPSHVPSSPCCPMAPAQQAGSAVPMHGEMTWWHSAWGHPDEPAGAGGGWRSPAHCGAVGIDPCKQQLPQQSQGKWGSSGRLEIEKNVSRYPVSHSTVGEGAQQGPALWALHHVGPSGLVLGEAWCDAPFPTGCTGWG